MKKTNTQQSEAAQAALIRISYRAIEDAIGGVSFRISDFLALAEQPDIDVDSLLAVALPLAEELSAALNAVTDTAQALGVPIGCCSKDVCQAESNSEASNLRDFGKGHLLPYPVAYHGLHGQSAGEIRLTARRTFLSGDELLGDVDNFKKEIRDQTGDRRAELAQAVEDFKAKYVAENPVPFRVPLNPGELSRAEVCGAPGFPVPSPKSTNAGAALGGTLGAGYHPDVKSKLESMSSSLSAPQPDFEPATLVAKSVEKISLKRDVRARTTIGEADLEWEAVGEPVLWLESADGSRVAVPSSISDQVRDAINRACELADPRD